MKKLPSYIRVILIFGLVFFFTEYFIKSEKPAFIEYPWIAVLLLLILFLLIAIEVAYAAIENITYQILDDKKKAAFEAERAFTPSTSGGWKRFMKIMTRSKAVEEEDEILRDHDFDGIKELDNALPPWWLYGFYITIIFSVIYLVRFHVFNDYTQAEEYENQMTEARLAIEEYKKKQSRFAYC